MMLECRIKIVYLIDVYKFYLNPKNTLILCLNLNLFTIIMNYSNYTLV